MVISDAAPLSPPLLGPFSGVPFLPRPLAAASCKRHAVQKVCWQVSVRGSLYVSIQMGHTSSC